MGVSTKFVRVGKIARRCTEKERAEAFFPPRVTTTAADHSARVARANKPKPVASVGGRARDAERDISMFAPPICRRR
jgi:hypothetical protein